LTAMYWSRRPGCANSSDWPALAGTAFLILACVFYFKLTRQFGLVPAWYFLAVLPAAWPLAFPAARRQVRSPNVWGNMIWMFLVFSLHFWAAGGVMLEWARATEDL
jgi:hypothetical protein